MKHILTAVVASCFCVAMFAQAGEPAAQEIQKAINTLNEAFEKRDTEALQRLMTPDHIAITPYYGGPKTGAEQIKSLDDLRLSEYGSDKMKFTPLDKNTVLITYPLTQKGTFRGKAIAPRSFASAVWVRRDGAWREAFYQETALGGE